jgi:hypothetical protein
MADFRTHVDLFLTEVSIELLGNKIYDINGKRQDKILNLIKALPEVDKNLQKSENSNDLLCSFGYQSDFTENEVTVSEFLKEQLDFILQDANTSDSVNQDIITFLKSYKNNQAQLLSDYSNLRHRKGIGNSKEKKSPSGHSNQFALHRKSKAYGHLQQKQIKVFKVQGKHRE